MAAHNDTFGNTVLSIVLWHQVRFATAINLQKSAGPCCQSTDALPVWVVATGAAASSVNSPFYSSFIATPPILQALRGNQMYIEVTSCTPPGSNVGCQTSGQIRGNMQPRRDTAVAFLCDTGTCPAGVFQPVAGMGVFEFFPLPNQFGRVGLNYWILTRYAGGVALYANNATGLVAADFALVPYGTSTGDVAANIVPAGGISILQADAFAVPVPLYGPGSTHMFVFAQTAQSITALGIIMRIEIPGDEQIANSTVSAGAAPAPSFELVAALALLALVAVFRGG